MTEVVLVVWVVLSVVRRLCAARVCERPARGPLRPGHGSSLRREHPQEPWPHRCHGCSAHDRARARDLHRSACQRHEAVEPPRDRGAGEVVVHARVARTGSTRSRPNAGDAIAKSPEVAVASNVRGGVAKASRLRTADHRPRSEDDHPGLQLRVERRDPNATDRQPRPVRGDHREGVRRQEGTSQWDRVSASTTREGQGDVPLEVKGIYKAPPFYPLLGEVSISLPFFDKLYERPQNLYTFLDVKGGREHCRRRRGSNGTSRTSRTRRWRPAKRMDRRAGQGLRQLPSPALRPARAGCDREPRRDDQHARPERLRAHT